MKSIFIHGLISLGVAFILEQTQVLLSSTYITYFLNENLVVILIALIAINSATLGIVLTKVKELIDETKNNEAFVKTKKEMILSVHEQIFLVFVSLILLLVQNSEWLNAHLKVKPLIEVSIMSCFVYALIILYDTAKSVFVILDFKKE